MPPFPTCVCLSRTLRSPPPSWATSGCLVGAPGSPKHILTGHCLLAEGCPGQAQVWGGGWDRWAPGRAGCRDPSRAPPAGACSRAPPACGWNCPTCCVTSKWISRVAPGLAISSPGQMPHSLEVLNLQKREEGETGGGWEAEPPWPGLWTQQNLDHLPTV